MMGECGRTDCHNVATARPVLLVQPEGMTIPQPAEVVLNVPVCDDHQTTTTVADLVNDTGWQRIVDGFRANGKATPDRRRLGLTWERIGDNAMFDGQANRA